MAKAHTLTDTLGDGAQDGGGAAAETHRSTARTGPPHRAVTSAQHPRRLLCAKHHALASGPKSTSWCLERKGVQEGGCRGGGEGRSVIGGKTESGPLNDPRARPELQLWSRWAVTATCAALPRGSSHIIHVSEKTGLDTTSSATGCDLWVLAPPVSVGYLPSSCLYPTSP